MNAVPPTLRPGDYFRWVTRPSIVADVRGLNPMAGSIASPVARHDGESRSDRGCSTAIGTTDREATRLALQAVRFLPQNPLQREAAPPRQPPPASRERPSGVSHVVRGGMRRHDGGDGAGAPWVGRLLRKTAQDPTHREKPAQTRRQRRASTLTPRKAFGPQSARPRAARLTADNPSGLAPRRAKLSAWSALGDEKMIENPLHRENGCRMACGRIGRAIQPPGLCRVGGHSCSACDNARRTPCNVRRCRARSDASRTSWIGQSGRHHRFSTRRSSRGPRRFSSASASCSVALGGPRLLLRVENRGRAHATGGADWPARPQPIRQPIFPARHPNPSRNEKSRAKPPAT